MEQWWHLICTTVQIGENMKYIIGLMLLLFASVSWANCTGCGEDGHQMCPVEDKAHEPEVVFAVCVFADGDLIDHKGANSMSDCLKTKREVQKKWRNRSQETDSVEINGITYKIDGESLAFMCDLVEEKGKNDEDGKGEREEREGKKKKEE